ncbi:MAG: HXXEE domain-containing protein [Gemmataceae bacterium]|nr:HXXEE domain-containing protein [Gemmataceae bacterium]
MTRLQAAFGALVLAQSVHSAEEYVGRLWESFPPARMVSGLVSDDPARGFLLANLALVTAGLWCWLWPVRRHWRAAVPLAWVWVIIEVVNGIGHPLWSLQQRAYTPGVGTSPLLFIGAVYLGLQLLKRKV